MAKLLIKNGAEVIKIKHIQLMNKYPLKKKNICKKKIQKYITDKVQ